MRLAPPALSGRLQKGLDSAYLLFGAEPLLVEESAEAVRTAARSQGVEEILRYTAGVDLDWKQLLSAGQALSLFASKRLLEIRLPTGRPGDTGAEVLMEFLSDPERTDHLVVILGKVDKAIQSSKWFKAIESKSTAVEARAVTPQQLPAWIRDRLRAEGIKATPGAIARLAYCSEGNLLFAAQEISKLPLVLDGAEFDEAALDAMASDQARFSVFPLVDSALAGKTAESVRMLHGLQREGSEAILVNWALAREIRSLYPMSLEIAVGADRKSVMQRHRVWRSRASCISSALSRLTAKDFQVLLRQLAYSDLVLKGQRQAPGGIWTELERAVLMLCGINVLQRKDAVNY